MVGSTRLLHKPAQSVRKLLIATGADRLVAQWANSFPNGLITRFLRPDNALYRNTTTRRVVRNGLRYDLDLHDYIEWTIYFDVERAVKSSLYSFVKSSDSVIDIGSNVGEVLMNFARIVGPSGRALGFEPNPATLAKCRRNLALNNLSNVELQGCALGNEVGEVFLGRPAESNAGADRVMTRGDGLHHVPVTTLDAFLDDHPIARLDLIKIDVEGFDLNVLRGAARSIEKFTPVLFVELSDSNLREQGDRAAELISWLESRDYRPVHATTGHLVRSTDDLEGCFFDIVAMPAVISL